VQLAESLLQIGEFAAAEDEATKLLANAAEGSEMAAAKRVIALAQFVGSQYRGSQYIQQAAQSLIEALELAPGDVELATAAASLLREHEKVLSEQIASPSSKADELMERVVALNPDEAEALLARYRYRKQYGLADEIDDLQRILELEPQHVEASLLLAAEQEQSGGLLGIAQAKAALQNVIESAPQDVRGYLALAQLLVNTGEPREARQVLTRGAAQVRDGQVNLSLALAEVLLMLQLPAEASQQLDQADSLITKLTAELTKADRIRLEHEYRTLRAKVLLAQGRGEEAEEILRLVTESASDAIGEGGPSQSVQASVLRAQLAEDREEWDLAATHWLAVSQSRPDHAPAHRLAGVSLLHAGRPDEAIAAFEQYRSCLPAGDAARDIAVELVQAHLAQQLTRPFSERDWQSFLAVLAAAKQEAIVDGRLVIAEAEYMRAVGKEGWRAAAIKLLQQSEASLNGAQWWGQLPLLYLSLGGKEEADRALRTFDKFSPPVAQRALVRCKYFAEQGDYRSADLELRAVSGLDLAEEDRRLVEVERAKLALVSGDKALATRLAERLVDDYGRDVATLRTALEIALVNGEFVAAEQWESQLQAVEGPRGTLWRLYRAVRLIETFDESDQPHADELSALIEQLQQQRPQWPPVLALAGRAAELQGETSRAIDFYSQALELGDRRPATLCRLVSLLRAEKRADEAASIAALVTNQALCRQTAQLCTALNRTDDAEFGLRRLVELAPEHFELLAHSFAERGQMDQAIEYCMQRDGTSLRASAAATLAELLSSHDAPKHSEARQMILEATAEFGNDTRLLLAAAAYLASQGETDEAIRLFRRVIAQDPRHIVALNNLATLLGEEEGKRDEALRHIERAIEIAGRRPALLDTLGTIYFKDGNHERARACLEEAVSAEEADPRYYFHLAGVYYRLGQMERARESLRAALGRELSTRLLTDSDRELLAELQDKLLDLS
jgi:tetratricopeptide (TPR) repeat protein